MKKWSKTKIVVLLVFVLAAFGATMITAQAARTTHFGDGFDRFDTSAWEKADGWANGNPFNCIWRASNVNFSGGAMTLTLNRDTKGSKYTYAGGEYRTKDTFGYGRYQVRMRPAKNVGIVSSFFTYNGNPWDEIDIEFLGKDTTKVQFNYYTKGQGKHEYIYNLGFDAANGYHTYAFDWRKGSIKWFVDGKEVYKATNNIPTTPGKIMMNLWNGIGVDGWLGKYNGKVPLYANYDWMSYDP